MIGNAVGSVLALILNLIIYLVLLKCEIRWEVPLFRFSLIKENLQYAFPMMVQEFFRKYHFNCSIRSVNLTYWAS